MIRSLLLPFLVPLTALAQIPAFPGAEGFGAYANGGRGGDVYTVTNLNNNGSGSLRVGLNTAPPEGRTIVFAVSGYIPVDSDTNFNVPDKVTIAGQTAPGDGVGLQGGRMLISGSDVVMRHFRVRHGRNGTGGDCINIAGSSRRTILDHVSMMFSTDENISFFSNAIDDFTMQNSSSSWGMERHNAGGLWDLQDGSCIDSLWAHHRTRNPKSRPYGLLEWVNNVTFNWRNEGFIMGDSQTPANWKTNAIGNYYISIDNPADGYGARGSAFSKARVASNGVPNYSLHLDDTYLDNDSDGTLNGTDRGYDIVAGSEFSPGDPVGSNRYYKAASPFPGASGDAAVSIDDALTAYKKVISSTGPLRLDANYTDTLRDELDSLLVDSVVNQYSVLVQKDGKVDGEDPDRPNNGEQYLADEYGITNNGFGTLIGSDPPTDSDFDGMPDVWEFALNGVDGVSYNLSTADHNKVFTAGQLANSFFPEGTPVGYTLLEEYLHFLAVPHATVIENTAGAPTQQVVDLAKYTDAFTASPGYTLTQIRNGTVQQFAANGTTPASDGPVVVFTPDQGFVGRAGFEFTVVDAEGSQWTQQFALLVESGEVPDPGTPLVRVNVDFDRGSSYTGTAAAPDAGTFWNSIAAVDSSSLTRNNVQTSDGQPSPFDVTVTSSGSTMSSYSADSPGNPTPGDLMRDYFYGNTYTVTVGDLPAGSYMLYVYAHGDQATQASTVRLAAANGGGSGTAGSTGDQFRNVSTPGAEGYSYLSFEAEVDASGTLEFSAETWINGFQLIELPLPEFEVALNVDFDGGSPFSGSAAAPDSGTVWNTISAVDASSQTITNARVGTGSVSPFDITVSASGDSMSTWSAGSPGNPTPENLMSDYLYGNIYTITVEELPAGSYALYVYAHGDAASQASTVTVAAANGGGSGTVGDSGDQYRNIFTSGAEGYSYLRFEPDVDGSGVLEFTVSGGTNGTGNGYLNGFQLVRVADPYVAYVEAFGLDPATDGAEESDPDGDGLENQLEFFSGLNPTEADVLDMLVAMDPATGPGGEDRMVMTFRRLKLAADLPFAVEYSPDLSDPWTEAVDGVGGVEIEITPLDGDFDQIRVSVPAAGPRIFGRLRL